MSARDIVELLAIYLPRRPRNASEVLRQIQQRHAARQRDLDSAFNHSRTGSLPAMVR